MPRRVSSPMGESGREPLGLASRARGNKGGSDDEADLTGSTAPKSVSGRMRVAILTALLLLSLYAVFQFRRLSLMGGAQDPEAAQLDQRAGLEAARVDARLAALRTALAAARQQANKDPTNPI